jgi:hypothetical protein
VVLLVLFALGWREAIVVGSAVVLTLALTLFASWAMGFTLNRVSLFALIFSIGILVDDAIVVVENIHRHMAMGGKTLLRGDPAGGRRGRRPDDPRHLHGDRGAAADGLRQRADGPVHAADPDQRLGRHAAVAGDRADRHAVAVAEAAVAACPWQRREWRIPPRRAQRGPKRACTAVRAQMRPFLHPEAGRAGASGCSPAWRPGGAGGVLAVVQLVVLKMLPFDNKSEFQVVVDLPEGSTLERTNALLRSWPRWSTACPKCSTYQGYAGTSAPINFNGLVRQYYLRSGANVGDLQVNLVDRTTATARATTSPARCARSWRAIGQRYGASVKVVEVPPGPPVLAPLVAEVYGPDYARSRAIALDLASASAPPKASSTSTPRSRPTRRARRWWSTAPAPRGWACPGAIARRWRRRQGLDATYLRDGASKYPRRCACACRPASRPHGGLLALRVRGGDGRLVPLSEVVRCERGPGRRRSTTRTCCRWST